MCREEIAVCSKICTEQIYALRGQKVRILIVVVRIATTCLKNFKTCQVRHPRCVDRITSIDKCSQTQLIIFVLLRGVSI